MLRKTVFAALIGLTLPEHAFALNSMSADEKEAFGQAVREYLLENPETIFEAVEVFRQREAEAEAAADLNLVAANADAIFNDGFSYVGGNPEGDITVVEFMDYRCGYCKRAHTAVGELIKADGNIRFIVKEFPVLGEASEMASAFAVAVKQLHGDAAYKATHDTLLTFNGDINEKTLRRLATILGHDDQAVLDQMNQESVMKEIAETRLLAARLQINGTPTFVFDDELVRGAVPLETMTSLVTAKRQD
jgi:protein-disulfide isomerase